MELQNTVKEALNALYHHPDDAVRMQADRWLQDFQRTIDAWQVSLQFLTCFISTEFKFTLIHSVSYLELFSTLVQLLAIAIGLYVFVIYVSFSGEIGSVSRIWIFSCLSLNFVHIFEF